MDNKRNKMIQNADESTRGRISLCVGKHRHIAHVTIKTNGGYAACTRRDRRSQYIDGQCLKKIEKHLKKRKARAQDLKIKSGFEIKKGPPSRNFWHRD